MFVRNVFKKITKENQYAKINSKKVLTSAVGFSGINQKILKFVLREGKGFVLKVL